QFVKAMRAQPTDAEHRLWQHLRRKQVGGLRFRRQYRLGLYIVDFVCLPARLVVEVDGGQHAVEAQKDERRTRWLETQGFTVVRFWNNDVLDNTDGVVEAILGYLAEIQRPPPPPAPSREGRG
ncbi:MAG: endonuclease domain-containing protein, partial [Dongiaceae bacterium]